MIIRDNYMMRTTITGLILIPLLSGCSVFGVNTVEEADYEVLISEQDYARDINAAIQFLEGRNQSVIDTFVKRMEKASEAQEYELAARFRDQVAKLKEIEARQLVSRSAGKDLDVLGFASNGGVHCVTVLFIRNGAVVGSRDHFPRAQFAPPAGRRPGCRSR